MKSSGNKIESAYNRLHRFRHFWIRFLVTLIILAAFIFTLGHYYDSRRDKGISSLSRTLKAAESYMSYMGQLNRITTEFYVVDYMIYLSARCDDIENEGFSEEWLKEANSHGDYYRYYYIDGNGNLHNAESEFSFEISDEEWEVIKAERYCEGEGWVAISLPAGDGMLAIAYEDEAYEIIPDALAECGDMVIIYDESGEKVLFASEPELLERGIPRCEAAPEVLLKADTELSGKNLDGGKMYPDTGSAFYDMLRRSFYLSETLDNGWTIQAYEPISMIFLECLKHAAILFIIMILFSIAAYRVAMAVRYRIKNENTANTGMRKFTRSTFINMPSASYLISVFLISVMFIVLTVVYIQTVSDYSSFYNESNDNLEIASETVEMVRETVDEAKEAFEIDEIRQARLLANYIAKSPEELDEERMASLKKIFRNSEIDVIDENGYITHSTGSYAGYTLSTIPEDDEYSCWELIRGDATSVFYPLKDGTYQVAVRRTDSVGIVRLTTTWLNSDSFLSLVTPWNALKSTHFSGEMLYQNSSEPGKFYRISSDGEVSEMDASAFGDDELLDGYVTLRKIDGKPCCILTKATPEFLIVNAMPVSDIAGGEAPVILCCLLCYILISIVLIICCSIFAGEEYHEDAEKSSEIREVLNMLPGAQKEGNARNNAYSRLFRKLIRGDAIICLAALFAFFLFDYLLNENPIMGFLLSGQWGKGANIFSISIVLLMAFAVYALCAVIRWVTAQLRNFLDSGIITAVNLTFSVIRVVCVGWAFFASLFQLGVDLTTIVAGLGIVTLALSVGAKDTINDLIAGVFIVLDGHVRIGDYIKVGSFYGEVVDMNIRTTKVKYKNQVVSVNNSSMVNVINCSRGSSGSNIIFKVPYGTDISHVKEVILNSADRFIKEGDGLITGIPKFCDVEDFAPEGISCKIFVPAEEKTRTKSARRARMILNEILTENGIEMAYWQFPDMGSRE